MNDAELGALGFDDPRLGLGGNQPPDRLRAGPELKEALEIEHAELLARRNEMLEMGHDFLADHASVDDDETSGILAGVIRQILGAAKSADQVRVGVKDPYLRAEKLVDNFFLEGMKRPLDALAADLNKLQTAYQRAKEDRRRVAAEQAAKVARAIEEARRIEAEKAERERLRAERDARRAKDDEASAAAARQRAEDATKRAEEARAAGERARVEREAQQQTAGANAAELSRVRGDFAMASLKTTWKFRIVDITKVPAHFLMVNAPMVNAAIRGKDGLRQIEGLEVYAEKESVNR